MTFSDYSCHIELLGYWQSESGLRAFDILAMFPFQLVVDTFENLVRCRLVDRSPGLCHVSPWGRAGGLVNFLEEGSRALFLTRHYKYKGSRQRCSAGHHGVEWWGFWRSARGQDCLIFSQPYLWSAFLEYCIFVSTASALLAPQVL